MIKRIVISVLVAIIAVFGITGAALADDPTTTDATWDGSGTVQVDVDSGDSNAGFITSGDYVSGTYSATDSNDNPYNYGVDSFVSKFVGHVENGYMNTGANRVNSYTGMYDSGGQTSYCYVGVDDGYADMAYRSTTNYAQMRDSTYTHQLSGGHNVVLNAGLYTIDRYIGDDRGNIGNFYAEGTGDATLDCMSAEASGCWDLKLGRGCGCYTDANYNANGAGYVAVTGVGNNSVTFNGMGASVSGGPSVLQFIANWAGSISIADYSLTAN